MTLKRAVAERMMAPDRRKGGDRTGRSEGRRALDSKLCNPGQAAAAEGWRQTTLRGLSSPRPCSMIRFVSGVEQTLTRRFVNYLERHP